MSEPDENGWMPIETAPKDERIQVWDGTFVGISVWYPNFENIGWDEDKEASIYRGGWTDFTVASWGYEEYTELKPTHWQPLPKPPVQP